MRFFEFKNGEIYPLSYPMTSTFSDGETCFLIYAQDEDDARKTAEDHLKGKPLETLYDFRWTKDVVYRRIEDVAVSDTPKP